MDNFVIENSQYNAFAKKYSEMVVENNQASITTYFRYLDIPLNGKRVLDLGCVTLRVNLWIRMQRQKLFQKGNSRSCFL